MRLLLAALAIALLLLGVEEYRINKRDRQIAQYKEMVVRAQERHDALDRQYRDEEKQRAERHREVYREQQDQIDKLQVILARERKSSTSLRDAFASYRCPEATGDSKIAGPAASAPADLRADVFNRIDEAAGAIARYADETAIALDACMKAYNSLR